MKNLAFLRPFGHKFDLRAMKLVSNPPADDVTVPNMAEAVKREK